MSDQVENMRRFLATSLVVAASNANAYVFWDMIAQAIASYYVMSGTHLETAFDGMSELMGKVSNLLENDGRDIWPELLPGGNQVNDLLPILEQLANEGVEKPIASSVYHQTYTVELYSGERLMETKRDLPSLSPLNLVEEFYDTDDHMIPTWMIIEHDESGEVTWWNKYMVDAVIGLNKAADGFRSIFGPNQADFDNEFQSLYEKAVERGEVWKQHRKT